ncbi:MAG: beta-N-acetylglucosaminidase domain-containing protein, partial [Sulfolobales archaeon]|nr:beta-N-acetylglucosaminidase domain-containing protein [Sulfolobales archaeon]
IGLMEFLGRVGLNTYIYAPKWDPRHRDWWRVPYGTDFLDRLAMLVDSASRYGIRVVFAVSPGLDIDYSSRHDRELLLKKLTLVMELGVEDLALLLDDIPPVLRGRGFRSLAEAQSSLVNEVSRELSPRTLVFCPTYYYGLRDEYMKELGRLVDLNVHVVWTGMWVASYRISVEDLESVTKFLGRKPFIWDNYPVNDYFVVNGITRLHLGPIKNRPSEFAKYISGYVSNPMNQCEASKIPLYTIAEALADPSYDPQRSVRDAVDHVLNKSSRYWFKLLLEFNKASFMDLSERTIASREDAEEVLQVVRELRESVANRKLLKEVDPVLGKMESIAKYVMGETSHLSWRIQTAGEYIPPITAERMVSDVFGVVARLKPWYSRAYRAYYTEL